MDAKHDAGDVAASTYSSGASYRDYRRFALPPVVNDYSAITLHRPILWVKGGGTSPFVEVVASTANADSLHFVVPYSSYFTAGAISKPPNDLTYRSILSGSQLGTSIDSIYEWHRIRCMKLLFEPTLIDPIDSQPPLDCYVWWVDNHTLLNQILDTEFESNFDIRAVMKSERITKMSHRYGHSFSIPFIPQMIEYSNGPQNQQHVIPRPWLKRGDPSKDAAIYTPIIIFRRPYTPNAIAQPTYRYNVSLKTCIEYKEPEPTEVE